MPATKRTTFATSAVGKVFDAYPQPQRKHLLALRELILETAAKTPGVGAIEETLKWGQPSYLTTESKSGTTIRIDAVKDTPNQYALFVHCQTTLAATYKRLYPKTFTYQGKRGMAFTVGEKLPKRELEHCIALALTYHLNRKR